MNKREIAVKYLLPDMSNVSEVKKILRKKHGFSRSDVDNTIHGIRRSLSRGRDMLGKTYVKEVKKTEPIKFMQDDKSATKPSNPIKISDIKEKYSLPGVIKRYLAQLSSDEVVTEREMKEDIGINKWSNYRNVLESHELEVYRGKMRDVIYWGLPKAIQKLKAEKILKSIIY